MGVGPAELVRTKQMIDYSNDQIIKIAAISKEDHIGLLSNCGISRDQARKFMAATLEQLEQGAASGEKHLAEMSPEAPRYAHGVALLNAIRRELVIRKS